MRTALIAIVLITAAGAVSAQTYAPGQPYIGDPLADRLRDRMEIQRLQSEQQAAFVRQQQLNARLTEMEIRGQRQPEPYIPLVAVAPSLDAQRRAREAATARREATAAGVGQIDSWLDRAPH
ncbi:hypothetical protein [Brevundimonas sp. NIBR11]|uniref:hypothetical protein n=1 Tax=Brevundimonas sp. NIBR11 TaxID=3015999 RepID=UPI0022F09E6F|nr:hypothetical protein [Brevundimonas sp. NIBR11]WGM32109.1 hypothetical protein KKHFBJBL_02360 [Brevundimonas sp. NIBR11]